MGGFEPNNYDDTDVSNYLNFNPDSEDECEDDDMTTPTPNNQQDDKEMATPLSPPASTGGDAIDDDDDEQDEDDLYGESPGMWKVRRNSSVSTSLDSPINPQWLFSSDPPRRNSMNMSDSQNHPSPPTSDDAKTPSERRTVLETIQERNELLVNTGISAKSSKSFSLLPELLSLKQAEDEDEKILASEEGKRLNPKERRQLRNKVSARNFRVRRKEYIGHLENLVESQTQEIESLRQSLNAVQLENNQLRQESGFLRSIALNHQPQQSPQPQQDPVMPVSHPNKDINPNTFEWPLAYDGMPSPTQPTSNKFSDRPVFGNGHIHAYGVRVPEVQFDKPHLSNSANALAPPLPPQPTPQQYTPNSPRSAQEAAKAPPGQATFPPGVDNLGYPHMLQAVSYLYDYIVKASNPGMMQPPPPPPQQPQPPPFNGYPMQQAPYHPPPQPWEAKAIGAPVLGFNPHNNGSWGWGGPPGPAV